MTLDERSETGSRARGTHGPPRRARARRRGVTRAAAPLLGLAALAGCQAYEPRPLDLAAHREAWHARVLEQGSLAEFLERLELGSYGRAGALDPSDGLTLDEGRLVALALHPDLRLARLRVGRAAAGAEHAGRWADPELSLSVLRITESVPDPWVIAPGLGFAIPLPGRLAAERGLAGAELRAARAAVVEAEWSVWHEVERAWVEWSAARLRAEETRRLVDALEGLVRTTSQLAERGELPRTEAALFLVEQAQRRNRLRWLEGEARAAEQRLRARMGLAPEASVELVTTLAIPPPSPSAGPATADAPTVPDRIAASNPSLRRLRREYEVSEQTLRREVREQVPDLTLGPLFESDEGQSRVGLLGAIPLPFLNANARAIAEARVAREIARAALEAEYESLVGRWAAAAARAEALAEQRADMEAVLVPLVDRQLEDAVQLLRLGEGTSLVLLESLARAHQTKLDLVETSSAEALARAEVAHLIGPPDPEPGEEPAEEENP